jgi:hypothetical protein
MKPHSLIRLLPKRNRIPICECVVRCVDRVAYHKLLLSQQNPQLKIVVWSNTSKDGILHSHRRENLKSYIALTGWALYRRWIVSPVRYELGFYIPQDDILHSHRCENHKSYIRLTGWVLYRRCIVSPVRYELSYYIPEDGILHSHRSEYLKSYIALSG